MINSPLTTAMPTALGSFPTTTAAVPGTLMAQQNQINPVISINSSTVASVLASRPQDNSLGKSGSLLGLMQSFSNQATPIGGLTTAVPGLNTGLNTAGFNATPLNSSLTAGINPLTVGRGGMSSPIGNVAESPSIMQALSANPSLMMGTSTQALNAGLLGLGSQQNPLLSQLGGLQQLAPQPTQQQSLLTSLVLQLSNIVNMIRGISPNAQVQLTGINLFPLGTQAQTNTNISGGLLQSLLSGGAGINPLTGLPVQNNTPNVLNPGTLTNTGSTSPNNLLNIFGQLGALQQNPLGIPITGLGQSTGGVGTQQLTGFGGLPVTQNGFFANPQFNNAWMQFLGTNSPGTGFINPSTGQLQSNSFSAAPLNIQNTFANPQFNNAWMQFLGTSSTGTGFVNPNAGLGSGIGSLTGNALVNVLNPQSLTNTGSTSSSSLLNVMNQLSALQANPLGIPINGLGSTTPTNGLGTLGATNPALLQQQGLLTGQQQLPQGLDAATLQALMSGGANPALLQQQGLLTRQQQLPQGLDASTLQALSGILGPLR